MIGIFCNGFRHLFKNAENHKPKLALVWKQHSVWICKYKLLENGNLVFIDTDEGVSRNRELANEEVYDFVASSRYYAILRLDSKNDEMWFNSYLHGGAMIMLPDDFQQMFENFCKNNNKQINNLIDKYGPPSAYHKFLYSICGNSINFYSWLLKNYFSYNVFIDVLFFIMQWNEKFASYANKLTKGTITAYKGYDDIVQLQSEMINILKGKRSNDSLMEFNTMQKHMLKDNNSPEIMEILNDFNKRPQAQRKNFVQKMSSVDDFDELVHNLRLFCESHFKWNRESFLEYLNNTQNLAFTIVFDENNVVIVKIKDYETIRKIAKTTSWCISKNKT